MMRILRLIKRIAGLILLLAFASLLLAYNLSFWPKTWYDEGQFLQVSKNLALIGKYGIDSSEGFRLFDPMITTGPTVIVPVALGMRVLGVGLSQARIIICVYAILTILAFFLLTSYVFDSKIATVASLLLLVTPNYPDDITGNFVGLGRMVMGEVPALLFIIIGSFLWLRSLESQRRYWLIVSGVFFGLAMLTKTICILIIAVLMVVWILSRIWHYQVRLVHVIIPAGVSLICLFLWYGYQAYVSESNYIEQLGNLDRINAQIINISLKQIIRSVRVLMASGVIIWGVPGFLYGFYLWKSRDLPDLKLFFLICLIAIWLGWFVLASIGWPRYAFIPLAIMNIFTAKLLSDLSGGFSTPFNLSLKTIVSKNDWGSLKKVAVTLAVILLIFIPLQDLVKDIISASDKSPFEISLFLNEHIPDESVIETLETELVFLTDRGFHQPSLQELNAAIRYVQFSEPYPQDFYDFRKYAPEYLVDGGFSKWTDFYSEELITGDFLLIQSIGIYDLYKLDESQ